jgi:hypothetical protein
MRNPKTSTHFLSARKALADKLDNLPLSDSERREISTLVGKFTAQAVRDDRVHRHTHDSLAKLVDVFFNRRPA